ncbi:hypothetical protein PSTG_15078 [Puccinia striiformis f. sp. tritici PST-78]|uniref:Reverse transcriptase domain-containing protein n=1 Tax=Puccinia striiformis f. sp. tritici PST-78 TaxID=1165861 RepID=A0A0L0UXR4_9BASI|nr:hypothetical protein PSTG_15078 [Puccinia striiformis f. sp. tritici PST-78]
MLRGWFMGNGQVAGCGSFRRPADAWKQIMWREFDIAHIFHWVNDNLFIKTPALQLALDQIAERSTQLGVKTHLSKISPFKEEQIYIGFIWNGAKQTVRLPSEKIYERVQQLKLFLQEGAVFTYNQVELVQPLTPVTSPELTKEWRVGPGLDRDIGWLETVAICLGLLVLAKLGALPDKTFIVWTDDTTTENLLKKRKSKHNRANEEWKIIVRRCDTKIRFYLLATHAAR